MENLAFTIELSDDYETALQTVTAALKEEGFGVLTEIDVQATLKKKLDLDFRKPAPMGFLQAKWRFLQMDSQEWML